MFRYSSSARSKSWVKLNCLHGIQKQRMSKSSRGHEAAVAPKVKDDDESLRSYSSNNSNLILSWLDGSICSEIRGHDYRLCHQKSLSFNASNERQRPQTANPISRINTMTYKQMVFARIGVRSKGFETYHTLEAPKTPKLDRSIIPNLTPKALFSRSAELSPKQSSRGGLLLELSLKGKPPERCSIVQSVEKQTTRSLDKDEKVKEMLAAVKRYLKCVRAEKPFKQRSFFFLMFYPDNFWNNYRHLEMELIIFYKDNEFLRNTSLRTCISIAEKATITHNFYATAKFCSAEYQYLMEMLKHIDSAVEDIGFTHHESHLLQVQRNVREFEAEYKLLVSEQDKVEVLRFQSDENLYQLKQCMEVLVYHRKQYRSILSEFDWFLLRYKQHKRLVQLYFQPLYEHFSKIQDDFAGDLRGASILCQFHDMLTRAILDNCRAHDILNQDVQIKNRMLQMLSEVQFKVNEKQRYGLKHFVVDGELQELKPGSPRAGSKTRELRRSRSPERRHSEIIDNFL